MLKIGIRIFTFCSFLYWSLGFVQAATLVSSATISPPTFSAISNCTCSGSPGGTVICGTGASARTGICCAGAVLAGTTVCPSTTNSVLTDPLAIGSATTFTKRVTVAPKSYVVNVTDNNTSIQLLSGTTDTSPSSMTKFGCWLRGGYMSSCGMDGVDCCCGIRAGSGPSSCYRFDNNK